MASIAIGVQIVNNQTEQNLPDYSRFQQIGADSSETKAENLKLNLNRNPSTVWGVCKLPVSVSVSVCFLPQKCKNIVVFQ